MAGHPGSLSLNIRLVGRGPLQRFPLIPTIDSEGDLWSVDVDDRDRAFSNVQNIADRKLEFLFVHCVSPSGTITNEKPRALRTAVDQFA